MVQELLIILGLILLNGLFSTAEISIVSARRSRLESLAKKGSKGAKAALELAEDPTKFLSTVQIGITLIGILTGLFSGGALSVFIQARMQSYGFSASTSSAISVTLVVGLITYLTLVLGELVPKKVGLLLPESLAQFFSRPMQILSKSTAPVVWLLSSSTNLIVKIFRLDLSKGNEVTEQEVKSLISQATDEGTFEQIERNIVERVFNLSDRNIASVMTSRVHIDWLDTADSQQAITAQISDTAHSHLLVCTQNFDNIVGVLPIKRWYNAKVAHTPNFEVPIEELTETPIYFPDSMGVLRALEKMRDKKIHLALVVNEYGSVLGVVTINDILLSLLPEHSTENAEKENSGIVLQPDGTFWVDGSLHMQDFLAYFSIDTEDIPELTSAGFNTVAGLFLHIFKKLPTIGSSITWRHLHLTVVGMAANRIEMLHVVIVDENKDKYK